MKKLTKKQQMIISGLKNGDTMYKISKETGIDYRYIRRFRKSEKFILNWRKKND